ncbi:MAG: hypothetical protein J3K34DRAFT_187587 [Monoraphidium minutum]|nr:MAG: hypothetical protein J3K34DRAFT_187587 [Monoraphidium minutum]
MPAAKPRSVAPQLAAPRRRDWRRRHCYIKTCARDPPPTRPRPPGRTSALLYTPPLAYTAARRMAGRARQGGRRGCKARRVGSGRQGAPPLTNPGHAPPSAARPCSFKNCKALLAVQGAPPATAARPARRPPRGPRRLARRTPRARPAAAATTLSAQHVSLTDDLNPPAPPGAHRPQVQARARAARAPRPALHPPASLTPIGSARSGWGAGQRRARPLALAPSCSRPRPQPSPQFKPPRARAKRRAGRALRGPRRKPGPRRRAAAAAAGLPSLRVPHPEPRARRHHR